MALLKPETIIAHPVLSGLLWAAATTVFVALAELVFDAGFYRAEQVPGLLVIVPVIGIAWGYATRWALLRKAGEKN